MKEAIHRFNFLIMLILYVIFTSCKTVKTNIIYDELSDEITIKQLANTSSLNVEPSKIYFTYKQNKRVISCPSNKKIKVVSSELSWCTTSVDKVRDNTLIEIQVTRNNGQDRTANITVSVGKTESIRIEVKQYSNVPVPIEGIPILAWFGVHEHTVERYREMKEAGMDISLAFCANMNVLATAMDAANTAGAKILINCPEVDNDTENLVNRFKDHPALAGYFIGPDEPWEDKYPDVGARVKKVQAFDNEHFRYVNLGLVISTPTVEKYKSCFEYFLREVPVTLLSDDDYPIMLDNNEERFLSHRWWIVLRALSETAKKEGIPWWGFVLTTKHSVTWDEPNRIFPEPTIADLRFQVYCNLAYGAQGIQYFTYLDDGSMPESKGPIKNGTKTNIWYTVQQMSREIKGLSSVFLGAQVIKVEHFAINATGENGTLPNSTMRFDFANRPAEAQIITKVAPANGTNGVVSFLKNGNRCYMIIINSNLEGGSNMSITITGGEGLQLIKKDGTIVPVSSESNNQTVTPGDVLIYGWDY